MGTRSEPEHQGPPKRMYGTLAHISNLNTRILQIRLPFSSEPTLVCGMYWLRFYGSVALPMSMLPSFTSALNFTELHGTPNDT
jgi:hypothetical protein